MEFVTALRFPMTYDIARLQADLAKALQKNWVLHYNTTAYSGNWTSIALLAPGGDETQINALNDLPVSETAAMDGCDYFREVLDSFPFRKTSARLLCLEVGAEIKPHRDYCLGYEDGVFRLHIPIVTNPDVVFMLAGERIVMDEGTCWYINANEEHSVTNGGAENRVHLVIDGERNDWTDTLFFSQASEERFERPEKPMPEADKQRMIAELERMGTPAAQVLIGQLRAGSESM